MSSKLPNEQHAGRGLQEGVRGVLADNTARGRQLQTEREHGQPGREATSAGETIQGDSSRSEHWSSNPEPHTSFRQDDADDEKKPPESRNESVAKAVEESLRQVGAVFSTLEANRMGEKQSGEQSNGATNTSTTQSAEPHTRPADLKSSENGSLQRPTLESGSSRVALRLTGRP